MKIRIYTVVVASIFIIACGGTDTSNETEQVASAEVQSANNFDAGKQLIAKSDCLGCHKEQEKLIGPSYVEVAKKYPTNAENIKLLAGKIINGGAGVWGEVPMTPHPQISTADAETMVVYILNLK